MRRGPIAGFIAAAAGAVALACGDFGADVAAQEPDGSAATSSSSSSSSGTGVPPGDAGPEPVDPVDRVDASTCWDFADASTLSGFEALGKVTQTTDGVVFKVDPQNADNGVRRNFKRPGGIRSSKVGFEVDIKAEGSFDGDEFTDIMNLSYGDNWAHTAFELQKDGLDVDMWRSSSVEDEDFAYGLVPADKLTFTKNRDFVWFESTWATEGSHRVSSGAGSTLIVGNTTTAPKDDLTVLVGGRRGPKDPTKLTFTLHKLCVDLF